MMAANGFQRFAQLPVSPQEIRDKSATRSPDVPTALGRRTLHGEIELGLGNSSPLARRRRCREFRDPPCNWTGAPDEFSQVRRR